MIKTREMIKPNVKLGYFVKPVRLVDSFELSAREKVQVLKFLEQQTVFFNNLSAEYGIMDFSFNGIWYTLQNFPGEDATLLELSNYK